MAGERKFEFLSDKDFQSFKEFDLTDDQIEKANIKSKLKIEERVRSYLYPFQEPNEAAYKELNMVMVGKTGVGKSSLGCSLLGKECFKRSAASESETKTVDYKMAVHDGCNLKIIDTPGFMDTHEDDVATEVAKIIGVFSGIHIFLIVLNLSSPRFTQEDMQSMKQVEELFGKELFNHAIIVFTRAASVIGQSESPTFQDYIEREIDTESPIHQFLEQCNYRAIAYENLPDTKYEEVLQRKNMIRLMLSTVEQADRPMYDNELFIEARRIRVEGNMKMYKASIGHDVKVIIPTMLCSMLESKNITTIKYIIQSAQEKKSRCQDILVLALEAVKSKEEYVDIRGSEFWEEMKNDEDLVESTISSFLRAAKLAIRDKAYEALANHLQILQMKKVLKLQDTPGTAHKVMEGLIPEVRENIEVEEVKAMIERLTEETPAEIELKTKIVNFIAADPYTRCDEDKVCEHFKVDSEVENVCRAEGLILSLVVKSCFSHPKVRQVIQIKEQHELVARAETRKSEVIDEVMLENLLTYTPGQLRELKLNPIIKQLPAYLEEVKAKLGPELLPFFTDEELEEAMLEVLESLVEFLTGQTLLDQIRESQFGLLFAQQ